MTTHDIPSFFEKKIKEAKEQFERTVDCKHIEFDDLYPYMSEQPQFFWYKRYVAWQELLTTVRLAEELDINWEEWFKDDQKAFIRDKVLDAKVLDDWYGKEPTETEESSQKE